MPRPWGKALLAFSSADLLNRIIGGGLKCYTPKHDDRPGPATPRAWPASGLPGSRCRGWGIPGRGIRGWPCRYSDRAASPWRPLELTVPNLRTDLQMASSVLTVAARGPVQRTRGQQPRRLLRTNHRAGTRRTGRSWSAAFPDHECWPAPPTSLIARALAGKYYFKCSAGASRK